MIEHVGMAAATAALRHTVDTAVRRAVNGASVTLRRPVAADSAEIGGPRANIYLYQSELTADQRNADLPFRAGDRTLRQRPVAVYDLRFLISFYGDDAKYEPQLMAGKVLESLHANQPSLTFEATEELDAALAMGSSSTTTSDERRRQLVDDYLEMRRQGLHFFQVPLTVSELSQLWSFLFRAPYTLTVAWQCSSVWLNSSIEVPSLPQVARINATIAEMPPPPEAKR
ncbi:MAG: DUF4255 domain-containing protein [Proteobacteria bacterium]|nr:DUF4255 domain-containing protein [Pseudomonadota bacterium]